MKGQIIRFFKMWTLPLGMFAGVGVYLMFHYIPWLSPLKVLAKGANDYILPLMVFIQLFTTFCKVNPREMKICKWHVWMITVQLVCCLAVALPLHFFPDFAYHIVLQGALVCLIVPTGTAAAVIAGRLGGNETTLTTYTIISNLVAAVMIPALFPLVEMQSAGSFGQQFLLGGVFLVEPLYGLEHKRVDNLLVVVPIEALFLEQGVELLVFLYQRAVYLAPQLPVGCIRVVGVGHVVFVYLAFRYLLVQLPYKLDFVVPRLLLRFDEVVEHLVFLELQREPVVCEFLRRHVCAFPPGPALHYFNLSACFLGYAYDERQHVVIQVVGF